MIFLRVWQKKKNLNLHVSVTLVASDLCDTCATCSMAELFSIRVIRLIKTNDGNVL